jgi:hypothetical protein
MAFGCPPLDRRLRFRTGRHAHFSLHPVGSIDLEGEEAGRLDCKDRRMEAEVRVSGHPSEERAVANFERIRDVVSGPFSEKIIAQRMASGWQMASIEWRRELPDDEAPGDGAYNEDIPYGLRISDDCLRLEVDPQEHRALLLMMDLLVQDFSFSSIVSDLNEKGFRMRDGGPWSRVSVFKMLPRLIEAGPRLFSTDEWKTRRRKLSMLV